MMYGDLRSKLAEGNAKECPSFLEKPLERTLDTEHFSVTEPW